MSALALGLIAAFAWGFHDICVRFVSQKAPLMACLLTVLMVGLGFHLGVMVLLDGFTPLPPRALGMSMLAGGAFLVASLGLYAAFQRGPVRLVSPVIASYPILSVAWATLQGTAVSLTQWLAVLAIVIGVSVVAALADTGTDRTPPKGPTLLYAAISAVGFAATFAFGHAATVLSDELPVTLVTRITAIALLVAGMVALRLPFRLPMRAVPVLSLMGLADGIALVCVVSAGGLPDAQYAAVSSSVFGLLTIVMAWAFLKEAMTPTQWLGCLVAFAAIGYLAV